MTTVLDAYANATLGFTDDPETWPLSTSATFPNRVVAHVFEPGMLTDHGLACYDCGWSETRPWHYARPVFPTGDTETESQTLLAAARAALLANPYFDAYTYDVAAGIDELRTRMDTVVCHLEADVERLTTLAEASARRSRSIGDLHRAASSRLADVVAECDVAIAGKPPRHTSVPVNAKRIRSIAMGGEVTPRSAATESGCAREAAPAPSSSPTGSGAAPPTAAGGTPKLDTAALRSKYASAWDYNRAVRECCDEIDMLRECLTLAASALVASERDLAAAQASPVSVST